MKSIFPKAAAKLLKQSQDLQLISHIVGWYGKNMLWFLRMVSLFLNQIFYLCEIFLFSSYLDFLSSLQSFPKLHPASRTIISLVLLKLWGVPLYSQTHCAWYKMIWLEITVALWNKSIARIFLKKIINRASWVTWGLKMCVRTDLCLWA